MAIFYGTDITLRIQFTKIWRIQNDASSAWTSQTQLVHVVRDELGSIFATTLKLKENWTRCAFLYSYNCHKMDWLKMAK